MHHATEERFAYQSQAGRILPEYRAVRNSLSGFKELVETPELAAEVTIQPGDLLDVDDVIANYKLNVTDVKIVDSKDTFN